MTETRNRDSLILNLHLRDNSFRAFSGRRLTIVPPTSRQPSELSYYSFSSTCLLSKTLLPQNEEETLIYSPLMGREKLPPPMSCTFTYKKTGGNRVLFVLFPHLLILFKSFVTPDKYNNRKVHNVHHTYFTNKT